MRFAIAAMLASACCVLAQNAQKSAAPPEPVIRVTTRLVGVNAVVHDKKGEPAGDLTKDDFILLDRGKEQKISLFRMESTRALPKPLPKLPPNIFSNHFVRQSETPTSVTIILFDGLNTAFEDQAYARKQLIRFLREIEPQDRIAVYLLGRTLTVLHDFTDDPKHLAAVLDRFRGRIPAELSASEQTAEPTGSAEIDDFLTHTYGVMSDFYTVNRALTTLKAMETIANHLAGIPGRKNLIWFSGGFPFTLGFDDPEVFSDPVREHRAFNEETERVSKAMNNANVAIYPVDARGLMTLQQFKAENARAPVAPGRALNPSAKNQDTMEILADATGGRAFYNTNDLKGAIRKAVEDAAVTYTLGFYPPSEDWDGKYHKVEVKVRRKGLDVRARKGFIAFLEQTPTPKQAAEALRNALASPLQATGIGINARMDVSDQPKLGSIRVLLQIDPANLTLQQTGGRYTGSLEMVFVQQTADGRGINTSNQGLTVNLLPERYQSALRTGLLLTKYVEPVKGAEMLQIVILDRPTGNIGSLHVPLASAAPHK